ncbi:putative reverse transcriptase domain-containing protein [Tanacetum coccineum]|uniref:Reverse transcriptase domain-containing protein n=1 Tax=Tanacetum coccineum TaxID=301880 RepID=A0ABQ5AJK7_9ASTR
MPEVPPSPDYVPGPEGPPSPRSTLLGARGGARKHAPPSPIYYTFCSGASLPPESYRLLLIPADQDPYLAYSRHRQDVHPTLGDGTDLWEIPTARIRQRDALPSPIHETEMPEMVTQLRKSPRPYYSCPEDEVEESGWRGHRGAARQSHQEIAGQTTLRGGNQSEKPESNILYRDRPFHNALPSDKMEAKIISVPLGHCSITCRRQSMILLDLLKADYRRTETVSGENGTKRKAHEVKPRYNSPTITDTHTATSVTSAQLQAMIDEGVTAVLAARATTRNGDDSHTSGNRAQKGVVDLTQCLRGWIPVFRLSTCIVEESSEVCTLSLALLCDKIFLKRLTKIEGMSGGTCPTLSTQCCGIEAENHAVAIEIADLNLIDRRINTWLRDRQKTRGSLKTLLEITKTNNQTKDRTQAGLMLSGTCGAPGHFKKDCPQWKNKNQGNGKGVARAYAVGVAGQNPNNNVVTEVEINVGLRLNIISVHQGQNVSGVQGCPVYFGTNLPSRRLRQVKKKQLKIYQIVKNSRSISLRTCQVFHIPDKWNFTSILLPGAAPVHGHLIRLAPSEMKELVDQLQELSRQRLYNT